MERKEYTNINKKYLAMAMSFLGFKYYKFQNDEGETVFTFENTSKFMNALHGLLALRKQINK